jgi:hypothetical protein
MSSRGVVARSQTHRPAGSHQPALGSESTNKCLEGEWPKKIYRLKEDQAFSLSLELGQREKVAWHPSANFLLPSVGGGLEIL